MMAVGCGSEVYYPLMKPHQPMAYADQLSWIGDELAAFPCIKLMAVGLRFSRPPKNTRLKKHANHAEGVQYAIKSLVKGTERLSRNASTCSARLSRASRRFFASLCFGRPRFLGEEPAAEEGGGGES